MSKPLRDNYIEVVAWSIAAIGIITIFCLPDTIINWGDNRLKTVALAILFLFGYGTDFTLRILEHSKKHGYETDERDIFVQQKAMYVGFIVLVLYIFILSITLYTSYDSAKLLPVGWVWFIAYTTIVVANLSTGIASIYYYKRQGE